MISSQRHKVEEQETKNTEVDDFLMKVTEQVLLLLEDPETPTISIWGWNGIGKSIIANKMMQELKKREAYFVDIIHVLVPQPYINQPDATSSDPFPNIRTQQMLHTPTQPETRLASMPRNVTFKVLHEPCLQELESALEEDDTKILAEFKEKFLVERAKEKRQLEMGTRWPTYQKLDTLHRMLLLAKNMSEKVENDISSTSLPIKLSMLKELEEIINMSMDEEAKELKLLYSERQTKEKMWELEQETKELGEKIRLLEKERVWASKREKWELQKKSQRELNEEEQISLAEQRRQLEEVSRRLKEEASRELNQEKRRALHQQQWENERKQKEIKETIQRLKEENKKLLQEEGRKAREEAQREMRLRTLQSQIMVELKITMGESDDVRKILFNRLEKCRFLLILKDVWENIDWQRIGIPHPTPGNGSKVVIIPTSEVVQEQMKAMVIQEEFCNLSKSQAWQLLNAEVVDVATTLSSFHNIIIPDTIILECFSYVSLFSPIPTSKIILDGSSLKEFWRSEGFLDELSGRLQGSPSEEEERVEELMNRIIDSLMTQLSKRCMLTSLDGRFQMSNAIWQVASSCKEFLIRSDSKQLPHSNEWKGSERISLSHNTQIHELMKPHVCPPNCPKLKTLLLNNNHNLISILPNFFDSMTSLQVLDLSSTAINSLPESISKLHKLRLLKLGDCNKLKDLPEFLKQMQKLEILDLHETRIKRVSLDGMLSLQRLDISGAANLTKLTVSGCVSLTVLKGLEEVSKLEELDLSGTKINQLPYEIFNFRSLKELNLSRMKHLKKIQWRYISRLPKQLRWQYCGLFSLNEDKSRCLISASDAALFDSLDPSSELSKSHHLTSFYFLICPWESCPMDAYACFKKTKSRFRYVYDSHCIATTIKRLRKFSRCVEVCGGKTPINGIQGILSMADSFLLQQNGSIKTVFSLSLKIGNVKECWIEKCRQLECVIDLRGRMKDEIMGQLEYLWLSDLPNLTTAFIGNPPSTTSPASKCLKRLYLECCPKLINFFSSSIRLPKLELLEIKFCPRLENVCGEENMVGQKAFPQLAELRLWELGKLKRICSGHLPMLKKLKIRGCQMLGTLPLVSELVSKSAIEIEGEIKWWESIRWEGGSKPSNIHFKDHGSFKA